jgi:hypothetical protein
MNFQAHYDLGRSKGTRLESLEREIHSGRPTKLVEDRAFPRTLFVSNLENRSNKAV